MPENEQDINITKNGSEEEYKTLRNEITENSKTVFSLFLANTAVTASLIGYALSENSGPIFLSPFIILIPSMFYIASQLESTTRISQYIRMFLEPELKMNWQTRWYELRTRNLLPHKRKYTFAITTLYGALAAACFTLGFLYWDSSKIWHFFVFGVPLVFLMVAGIVSVNRAFSKSFREEYAKKWSELKRQMEDESEKNPSYNKIK
ncbi:hypothetical protein JW935_28475 [candidate division KSB1 bacterium]|nr:hypothetical protein [candidate division KSB1 bacterium]